MILAENTFSDAEANRIVDSPNVMVETSAMASGGQSMFGSSEFELRDGTDEGTGGEEPQDNSSTLSSEPFESNSNLTCLRTGLVFPSSVAMKLLASYDDGLTPRVISAPLPSEPVFCRICREGIHDDADDEQPSPTMENDADEGGNLSRGLSSSPTGSFDGETGNETNGDGDDLAEGREPIESEPTIVLTKGPVQPNPIYHPNTHASENPMLSPCECAGSMAFVHYMCVEQWRCQSRHPDARAGHNCETCGKPYALPPPAARPTHDVRMDNDDWLDAMPPHVINALRNPHTWWKIGAALVRRKWLRPIAPVIMSPIVALYCRARRLLKKRGVARRRWACSLCRRRARWKCVRCLRSYYCSRQCQNVSWHIVHKHVCYKPSRYFWSVVVYGVAAILLFPGMLRDPIYYDAGVGFIPVAFYAMAVLGGGIATLLKKSAGVDLRGRMFELLVVAGSLGLVLVLWGLLGAFVGTPNSCYGILGEKYSETTSIAEMKILQNIVFWILKPSEKWFGFWDRAASNSWPWFRRIVCMPHQIDGCFQYAYNAKAENLFLEEEKGKCGSDMLMLFYLLLTTIAVALANSMWKRRDRQRRGPRRVRLHQD
jgi:RING-variant domain